MTTWHVLPIDDLIGHTDSEDCICGPEIEPLEHDGTVDWLVTHYSLDGRENHETEPEVPKRSLLEEAALPINFIFAVSAAYLAAMVASYIHTRRNR